MTPVEATLFRIKSKHVEIRGKTYWLRRWMYRLQSPHAGTENIGVCHDCQVLKRVGSSMCWVAIQDFEANKALCEAAWGDYP